MNINEVKELIELINNSELSYFEFKTEDCLLKMDKSLTRNVVEEVREEIKHNIKGKDLNKANEIKDDIKTEENKIKSEEKIDIIEKEDVEGIIVKAPMVGTFYSAPSPDSNNFVSLGDKVNKGDTLCIIEAMKLMNEIESDFNGKVVEILAEDGDMVEYGTPLFKIKEEL